MYFTHPQIKLNLTNLKKIFLSFFKKPDFKDLKKELSLYFPEREFLFTDMGRTAFRLIIEKFNLQNSKILMPAYICDIFYPLFKEYNITPVFLDIDLKTFNITCQKIAEKITPRVKAVFICHTYGLAANLENVTGFCHQNNLLLIEDCAHGFAARTQGKYAGNFGDVAFFSLYKQFPCLRGGMLVFKNKGLKMKNEKCLVKTHFSLRDFISLLNCFPFFSFLFKKFGSEIAPKMLRKEKTKEISKINGVSLNLFSAFLKGFEKNLNKRIKLANFYQKELKKLGFETQTVQENIFTYLSCLTPRGANRDKLVQNLRKYKIFATRIWHTPIILNKDVQKEYKINLGEFKNTMEAAKRIINFPLQNFYTENDISKIIIVLKKLMSSKKTNEL